MKKNLFMIFIYFCFTLYLRGLVYFFLQPIYPEVIKALLILVIVILQVIFLFCLVLKENRIRDLLYNELKSPFLILGVSSIFSIGLFFLIANIFDSWSELTFFYHIFSLTTSLLLIRYVFVGFSSKTIRINMFLKRIVNSSLAFTIFVMIFFHLISILPQTEKPTENLYIPFINQ